MHTFFTSHVEVLLFVLLLLSAVSCRTATTPPLQQQAVDPIAAPDSEPVIRRPQAIFDREYISNYSLHVVDTASMVEVRRTCIDLDSPNVLLKKAGSGLVFCASDGYGAPAYFQLTSAFEMRPITIKDSPACDPRDVPHFGEGDPTKEIGPLPGMYPISAAVKSQSGRYVYYSVENDPSSFTPLHTIVRFDTKKRRITARLRLQNLGCKLDDDFPSEHCQIHYLFLRDDGLLVALAGSAAIWVP